MKKTQAVALVLVSVALSHALTPAIAWAQAKAQSAGLSLTGSSGLSGSGTAVDPLACTAASASSAGCVTTSGQTLAGAKNLSTSIQSPVGILGGVDAGVVVSTSLYTSGDLNVGDNDIFFGGVTNGSYISAGGTSTLYLGSSGNWMGLIDAANGNVEIRSTVYLRSAKTFAGAPTAGDCDAAGELGRITIDTTNHRFYWCEGAAGWKYAAGT